MSSDAAAPSRSPDTLLVLLAVAALFAVLVPWIPAGHFLPGQPIGLASYVPGESALALSLFSSGEGVGFLNLFFDGFTSGGRDAAAIGVIAFVLTVGGAFGVVQATGSLERGLQRLLALTGDHPRMLLVMLFVTFSLGGAVFGMGEEVIAFLAILMPLLRRLGYPPETAVMVTYLASQIGFGTSWMNPFSVAVAQGVVGLPLLSGAPLRIGVWAVFTALALAFSLHYAQRHRRAEDSIAIRNDEATLPMQWVDHAVLLGVLATVAWIIWGVVVGGYYIAEIATQFFTLGLFAGVLAVASGRLRANAAAAAFTEGVKALVPTALVIALAKGLLGLLGGSDPHAPSLLNNLLFSLGSQLQGTPELLAAWGMLSTQAVFNFFVSSGSAQAALTMPLMGGLGELLGLSKQISVLAFQLGDGLTNLLIPTSGAMMGAIGVAGVSWLRWVRVIGVLVAGLFVAAMGVMALAVVIGYA